MKKWLLALLLCAIPAFTLSSCALVVCNSVETGYLNVTEQDGETYIEYKFSDVYSIDLEEKTFALVDNSEAKRIRFEDSESDAFKGSFSGGGYSYIIPDGFDSIVPHIEACALEGAGSIVDACGYLQDENLVGFVQVYEDVRTVYGNYALEEIDHSLVFVYDAESDTFTVEHRIEDVAIVAMHEDTVIYWKDRAYYKYDLQTQEETYLTDDKAYDAGLTQHSTSGVYSNSDICVMHMTKSIWDNETDYMYVYDWSEDDFFELYQQ